MHEYYKTEFSEEYAFLEDKKKVIIHGFARGHQRIQIHEKTVITCYKHQYEYILLFPYGISIFPDYREGVNQEFVLIFEGLPDDCETFHLQIIPDIGTWRVYDFEKNDMGLYEVLIDHKGLK